MRDVRVLIVGGSSGIGLALATLVAEESDFALQVTAPSTDTAARTQDLLGPSVRVHVLDFLDVDEPMEEGLVSEIDAVVLCAGIEYVGPVQHEPPDAFEQVLKVNVAGPAAVARGCLPGMIERRSGLIIGLGSIVARDPRPFLAAYSASKAAFEGYLAALTDELEGTGVEVEVLSLGPVSTALGSHGPANWMPGATSPYRAAYLEARSHAQRERAELVRTPADVANEVLELLCSFADRRAR